MIHSNIHDLKRTKSLEILIEGNNGVITAETGCGKTLCYLLPLLNDLLTVKE